MHNAKEHSPKGYNAKGHSPERNGAKEHGAGGITLSARLQALADMVTEGSRVCDLGCDHGYLSIYLIQHKISPRVLAMDVREGPLGRAGEHVRRAGLEEYITLRLSDGLDAYRMGEADTLVCAGMGGPLMRRILEREPAKAGDFRELILQPQSEVAAFRRSLREAGWRVACEDMVLEDGKFYPMMKVCPAEKGFVGRTAHLPAGEKPAGRTARLSAEEKPVGRTARLPTGEKPAERQVCPAAEEPGGVWRELGDRFGARLLEERHPVLWEYLKSEWKKCRELWEVLERAPGSGKARQRMDGLSREMEYLKEAARLYGNDYD